MKKAVEAYFHLLKIAMVLCLVVMVVLVFGNVVLRYGFNSGITVSEEISRLCFLYLTFLGAIVAMREHLHLGVDSLEPDQYLFVKVSLRRKSDEQEALSK
jgi:TRAP-type C4-dicarboxylate transport system permease small subunit